LRATGAAGIDIIQSASTFTTSGNVFVDSGSRIDVTGAYTQTAGSTVLDEGASTATLTASTIVDIQGGTLSGNGTVSAATVQSGGTIAAGLSAGQLDIVGDLTLLDSSIMSFELGGTSQGTQYDFISVSGDATFDGDLEILLIDSFENSISISDTFTILSGGNILGGFDNIASGLRLDTADGFGSFLVNYAGNDLVLSEFASSTAVPEPSSVILLSLACGTLVIRRRTRKS